MVNYWKSKVLPKIKKVFENPKKAAALEACKAFDESKEQYSTEFEEKKTELQPKVVELYEACPAEVKALVKEPKELGLKKNSAAVQKFLDELAAIEFPGSKSVSEAATKVGPGYLAGPVTFVFEKVSTFIVVEEKTEEAAPPAETPAPEKTEEETSGTVETKDKEIAVEPPAPEPVPEATGKAEEPAPAAEEPPKVEVAASAPVAAEPPKP
ncbi:hypothetical protein ABTG52_09450 [Acinetobacter baumannii]